MIEPKVEAKWDAVYAQAPDEYPQPAWVLAANSHLLPKTGDALDLACGLGGNALFLAAHGLSAQAWDVSRVAIAKLVRWVKAERLQVQAEVRDVTSVGMPRAAFDVVVVSRFLDRGLVQAIIDSLKPSGLLFYQTYTVEKAEGLGPNNPQFLLAINELLVLFSELRVVLYREEGRLGDLKQGLRNEACLIGQRR